MSFDVQENSIEDGRPLRFYLFVLPGRSSEDPAIYWRYTSADATIQLGGYTWIAIPIEDDGVNQTGESTSDALSIRTTTKIQVAKLYMTYPPSTPVTVQVLEAQEGDEDEEMRVLYVGEITQCDVPQPGRAVFTCETLAASMAREGLRLGWQRSCPYALYDQRTCKASRSEFEVNGTVASIDSNTVEIPELAAYPSGKFSGGFVEWTDPIRGVESRGIESHDGAFILMFGTSDGLLVAMDVRVFPGCARTTEACATFNNLDNYGGSPSLQGKSPFDGKPVFN